MEWEQTSPEKTCVNLHGEVLCVDENLSVKFLQLVCIIKPVVSIQAWSKCIEVTTLD